MSAAVQAKRRVKTCKESLGEIARSYNVTRLSWASIDDR